MILTGEGDISGELKSISRELSLDEQVEFLGYVEPNVLEKLTPRAEIGINLLENKGLSYYHSLANKFFAYVQAEVPQICINFPEYRMMNEKYEVAILVDDLKKETLINAVQKLRNDTSLYQRLKENCNRAAGEWNWEVEKGRFVKLMAGIN